MASQHSHTITTEQAQERCRSLVLKLTTPSQDSAGNEPQRMLNDLQKRVNNRFDILVKKFVMDGKQMNAELMEKLQKVKDPDTFLELVLTHLYGKAVKEEENVVSPTVNEKEKHEITTMVEEVYAKEKRMN